MFSKKNIIITIGNNGSIVSLHTGNEVKKKIFLDGLNKEVRDELSKNFFSQNKLVPIYILLDTIDQSYKKKVYPAIRTADLSKIIKRDLASDGDKDSLKNYITLKQKNQSSTPKESRRKECLFVSVATSEIVNSWIEFLSTLPNQLAGIYALPIESFNLFKTLKNNLKSQSKVKNKKNDLYCFLVQNKASGIRQMVFSDQGIIFTRVFNYDTNQADFLQKYEQDIYSTFEYLKRLFPDLLISELSIVNIFSKDLLEKVQAIQNVELHFINYTPYKAAFEAGLPKVLTHDSKFSDILISSIFFKNKKILKFVTPKIKNLEKFFIALSISRQINLLSFFAIFASIIILLFYQISDGRKIEVAEIEKLAANQELTKIKQSGLEKNRDSIDEKNLNIDRIFDFGKTEEQLGKVKNNVLELYTKLRFLKEFNMKLKKFSYSTQGFSSFSVPQNFSYKLEFSGDLFNESGDIDNLFKEFDGLTGEVKKRFEQDQVTNNELPTNIDFNKKYHQFLVNFTINSTN